MTEPDWLQQFGEYLKRRSPERRTAIDYVSDVRQFAVTCAKPWRDVTMQDVDTFVDGQRQAGRSPATIKRRVAALKVFFDFLAEETGDLAWANPVRFKRHAGKQPQRLPRDLKDSEIEQVWAAISAARDRAWFALMLRAGLRVSEVVTLRLDDLLASPHAEQPARLRVLGKGQKERLVLLTPDAYAVLQAWLAQRPSSSQPYVFLNERGQPLSVNGVEWLLHQYGHQVGLELTPHQLRHTYARQLTEAGMPITSLSKLLGHNQITTTQIYTAGADPQLAQAYQTAMAQLASPPLAPDPPLPVEPPPPVAQPSEPRAPRPPPDWTAWAPYLPDALRCASLTFVQRRLPTWKPQRQRLLAFKVLGELRRFWDWQLAHRAISSVDELRLADLQAFQSAQLARGLVASTIDRTLDYVVALLHEQADQGQVLDASLFRLRRLPRPDSLPRHLTDSESQRLEGYLHSRLQTADAGLGLENACFLVLAHAGLRASECVDLQYQDLDLAGRCLLVRQGKGHRDRQVYLSDSACQALGQYLNGHRRLPTAALFSHARGQPITYHWLWAHIGALGHAAGVDGLTPHRLRHTLATRLLNAGMDITRIQKLLGHKHVTTTMIYARVADRTVEADYRQAMSRIEQQQMPLSDTPLAAADWPARQPAGAEPALKDAL